MDITPEQIRSACAFLRLEQAELTRRAHVSFVTIRRLEGINGGQGVTPMTLEEVRQVLEQAAAEFFPDGIRRRHSNQADASILYEDLRAISLRSAARLQGRGRLTDMDLYDEDGLPT